MENQQPNDPQLNPDDDPILAEEREHLAQTYAKLVRLRDDMTAEIEVSHQGMANEIREMSDEVRVDFGGADETIETLAAIETLNFVIDSYNQYHDFTVDQLRRVLLLLRRPYFAKVRLKMRPGRPARDIYIGAAGVTDEGRRPIVVDWRSPVAETYYNQEMGETTYTVDGRVRHATLELRRQFDIHEDRLDGYFDTTVAIEDRLLLNALKSHHSEKLRAITATIQREQNEVVRHEDVPCLLVNGIAGSGKTSVLLQRIAFLFYRERETLTPDQVTLFTPNSVFQSYIDTVLPSLGESNPQVFTWDDFMRDLGLSERGSGAGDSPDSLEALERGLAGLTLGDGDFREIRVGDTVLLKAGQVTSAAAKFERFGVCPRFSSLVKDELHDRLDRRLATMAKSADVHEEMLSLGIEEQIEMFGETINPLDEAETVACAREYLKLRYDVAHDLIERADWLRVDRIGMRILGKQGLTGAEWLYLKLLITGNSSKNTRYVLVDEVQDYTQTQLTVLSRYFSRAHFLLLGDENQAIRPGTATFPQIDEIFSRTHGGVERLELLTSYRSSPEITELFASLMDESERARLSSVRRAGVAPRLVEFAQAGTPDDHDPASAEKVREANDAYLAELRSLVADAAGREGLAAVVCDDRSRVRWLSRQLGDSVHVVAGDETLPADGVVLMDLALAKGLEFDEVIVPDAQAATYPDTPLAKRRLYTAISRAMHRVTLVSQGPMTPLLDAWRAER